MVNIEYKSSEVNINGLHSTETGVKINYKISLWRIVWSYTKYLWYKIRDWIMDGDHGPTSMVP